MPVQRLSLLAVVSATALLAACGSMSLKPMTPMFAQDSLPDAVKVPAGNRVALETVGMGDITYECRDKANAPGVTEWVFVGPNAVLNARDGKQVGKYYGPPATWESMDGSKLTATQLAVAPAGVGNIPNQLVKANPAMGSGMMTGVTHIQRVAIKGGVAPGNSLHHGQQGKQRNCEVPGRLHILEGDVSQHSLCRPSESVSYEAAGLA